MDIIGIDPKQHYTKEEAEKYNRSRSIEKIQKNITLNLLNIINLKKSSYVLDIGCGTGFSMEVLSSAGYKVTGIDISESMLDIARSKGLDVRYASFEKLPFEDNTFDALVSISSLQWIQGKNSIEEKDKFRSVALEFQRVLKPGCIAGFQFYPSKEGLSYDAIVSIFHNIGFITEIHTEGEKSTQKPGNRYLIIYNKIDKISKDKNR